MDKKNGSETMKKGYNFFCNECELFFRFKQLEIKELKVGIGQWIACPNCKETISEVDKKEKE